MRRCTVNAGCWGVRVERFRRQTLIRLRAGGGTNIWLKPAKARKLAAALVTMADEIDKEKADG